MDERDTEITPEDAKPKEGGTDVPSAPTERDTDHVVEKKRDGGDQPAKEREYEGGW